jgi:hypothetical protein
MRKTILALATAGALAGTALPALAWDRDDYDYRPYRYHRHCWLKHGLYWKCDYDYGYYRRYHEHPWWWRHRHHYDDYDRPYYRRYY